MMILMFAPAIAADLTDSRLMLGAGLEAVTNDPLLVRVGVRQSIGWSVNDWVELGGSATYYPILGSSSSDWSDGAAVAAPDLTPLGRHLIEEDGWVSASRILFQGQLNVRVHLLRAALSSEWTGNIGFFAGVGFIATQDDLVALGYDNDEAIATQNQVHGSSTFGGFVQARTRWVGVRLRYESDAYVETINSSVLLHDNPILFGVELLCWL